MAASKTRRPARVTVLILIVLWLAAWNGIRLGNAIYFWKTLEEYGTHPVYIAISGGFWLLAAVFLARGLWQGKVWARAGTFGGAAGYGSWYWFDRLALQTPHANWLFALVTTVVFLLIVLFILFSPRARQFFSKRCL